MDYTPARVLDPWDFPGKNTGVGCHFFLQRIFPTQGSNSRLLHCRQIRVGVTLSSSSAWASHCGAFSYCRAQACAWAQQLWLPASRAQAQQLWHTSLVAPRILLDQGPNPCLLHWQAGSFLLSHPGSPSSSIF